MTKWEIGQDLIAISDYIGEKITDLRLCKKNKLADKLKIIQAQVGDLFNENNDHSFGITDSSCLKKTDIKPMNKGK